ncbi:MAG: hypothetical protein HGN29_11170, partial [Asgard group archaeon]|nr:hypothetical protein [Asgard group archaeon]
MRTVFFVTLFFSSTLYLNPDLFDENELFNPSEIDNSINPSDISERTNHEKPDSSFRVKTIETPGDYQLRGFFSQDNFIDIDSDGDVVEWRAYEDVYVEGWDSSLSFECKIDSNYQAVPDLWPDQIDTYYYLKYKLPHYPVSAMFSPVFEDETYIDGKVHFMTFLSTDFTSGEGTQIVTFRIKLLLFNSTDSTTSEILSIEDTLPEQLATQKRTYNYTLGSPVIIPAGFRLKTVYEAKLSTLSRTGRLSLHAGEKASGSLTWNINDGEYSNTYSIDKTEYMLGVQFKMYDSSYPEITVSGINNNTVYREDKTINIDVSGANSSSYRWDGGSLIDFDTSTTTDLPFTYGWHTLEIQALDEFNNNKTEIYEIGCDTSGTNIVLNSPSNNSLIRIGYTLYFTPYSIDYAMYEWDSSGAQNLTVLNYELIAPAYSGVHNLTIITYDYFGMDTFFYVFEFDNNPPLVVLQNVVNDTSQPAGKSIDVNITDYAGVDQVYYKWDTRDNLSWTPFLGSIYRTYLPESAGEHWLYVSVNDTIGNSISSKFNFTTDISSHFVELRNVNDDSFYQGNNTIEVTIISINGTIIFYWNAEPEKNGTIDAYYFNSILTLNESNVLPDSPIGIHTLTIITFDTFDEEHIYTFVFTLDQESPTILTSKDSYDNKRFLDTEIFDF